MFSKTLLTLIWLYQSFLSIGQSGHFFRTIDTSTTTPTALAVNLYNNTLLRGSYYDPGTKEIKFLDCLTSECTPTLYTIDNTPSSKGKVTQISVTKNDYVYIAYYDIAATALKFVVIHPNRTIELPAIIDGKSADAGVQSALILMNETPIIYYRHTSHQSLKRAYCLSPPLCTNFQLTTVDNSTNTGIRPTALYSLGSIYVCYEEPPTSQVVHRCFNPPNCTGTARFVVASARDSICSVIDVDITSGRPAFILTDKNGLNTINYCSDLFCPLLTTALF